MHRRWLVNKTNPEYIKYLSRTASVSPVLAQILVNRGIKTAAEVQSFLNPRISQLYDPFDIPGMSKAVERIKIASREGETVLTHGDYDVDGLTSTAILLRLFELLDMKSHYFIPNRMEHGYGFNPASVKKAKEIGASLIITVDCGITSFEAASVCRKEKIDLIITDHHEPLRNQQKDVGSPDAKAGIISNDFLLPDAVAVINPKISNPCTPVENLSGAGVAFKLAQALLTHDSRFAIHDFLDLAALGTIADIVPITAENRLIVKEGLKFIENGTRPPLKALKRVSGIDGKSITTGMLLFTVIPRMNAAGRISDSADVIKFLLADSEDRAEELAGWLDKLNTERQRIEEEIFQEAIHMLGKKDPGPVIVLSSEKWHRGVIGIVASRIAEMFNRPTFILSIEGQIARGSARSIPSFDIHSALTHCRKHLRGFGGHRQAAGLELDAKDIPAFIDCMEKIAIRMLSEQDIVPSLEIDAHVLFPEINFNLIGELQKLEPFGSGNPEPLLGSKGLEVLFPRIVKNNHLKMKLRQKSHSIDAIGFDMALFMEKLEGSSTVDAVFTPMINEWEGMRSLQLNIKALRPAF